MKMKCLKTGEILSVDHVVATDEHGNQWIYRDGIEAFTDPNTSPYTHTETQIAELTKTIALLSKTMATLAESQEEAFRRLDRHQGQIAELFDINSRLSDRLNTIE